MSQQKIELLKARDFSEIINDTFLFIRQNFKPLINCFFTFCGFFIIASIATLFMQQLRVEEAMNSVNSFDHDAITSFSYASRLKFLGWDYILVLLFSLLNSVMISTTVYSYMALYKEKSGVIPTTHEVWGYIRYYFLRILGATVVMAILLILGFVFCLVPGIYLFPIFGLVAPLMIFENTSFGYAFNQSFRLIKNYWWTTFGAIFVIVIIVYFCSAFVMVPVTLVRLSGLFLHPQNGLHTSAGITLLTTILQALCTVFHILANVTVALCYFNLTEVKEGTGLLDRMQNFGNPDAPGDQPAEEY